MDLSFLSVQKVTFGTLGYGPRAQSVLHCHGVLALRQGRPSWKSRFGLVVLSVARFGPQFLALHRGPWHSGFGTLGYGPRAQSVLHCHGVLALRQGPWKSRFGPQFLVGSESNVWHSGLRAAGPIRPSLPWCLSPARGSLDRSRAAQKPAARQRRPVLHCHGVLALRQGPWTPAWTAAVAGKVTVWTSVSCRFRK